MIEGRKKRKKKGKKPGKSGIFTNADNFIVSIIFPPESILCKWTTASPKVQADVNQVKSCRVELIQSQAK
jgi:hypothetical protein